VGSDNGVVIWGVCCDVEDVVYVLGPVGVVDVYDFGPVAGVDVCELGPDVGIVARFLP
jgi:hypothetical protein